MFKKRNPLSKLWLKFTNKNDYKQYKWELKNYYQQAFHYNFKGSKRLNSLPKIKEILKTEGHLNVNHSGNAGDIIYALPTLKKLHELTGAQINLYLRLNQPLILSNALSHPLGNVMLNQKMTDQLSPLISKQEYINLVEPYADQSIHIDLDYFRSGVFPLDRGNIARWCGYTTGVSADLWKKWLDVTPNEKYAETIILARSGRYQNVELDFSFLKNYQNIKFVGVSSEFVEMQKIIPQLEWVQVNDFLELAEIIAGCKFFIGNQSFPFSIAEGLKVSRILELPTDIINVVPEGPGGYDVLFQDHFESLVEQIANN
ncbi:hypothetical protein LPB86_02590 [Pedobacter sp. MC2016-14]|uniref:hypothetical protein n=1 Tax=Pedobacter sp. MC2016-14 TaxID=2897327 RepID=UPI001E2A4D6D|nr:hypothetical protein [Pedobacter sp. MC2016-14]MCD0487100.1 hypothetical protein [Pedobacter sp. MC2016-14]